MNLMNSSGDTESQLDFDQRDSGIANTALPKNVKRWSALFGDRKNRSNTTAEKWVRTLVFRHIGKMNRGVLTITDQSGIHKFGSQSDDKEGNSGTGKIGDDINAETVSYTHLTLPTTPYV